MAGKLRVGTLQRRYRRRGARPCRGTALPPSLQNQLVAYSSDDQPVCETSNWPAQEPVDDQDRQGSDCARLIGEEASNATRAIPPLSPRVRYGPQAVVCHRYLMLPAAGRDPITDWTYHLGVRGLSASTCLRLTQLRLPSDIRRARQAPGTQRTWREFLVDSGGAAMPYSVRIAVSSEARAIASRLLNRERMISWRA
jgi:hypothetical protein